MEHVLIDTQFFDSVKLNFESPDLAVLREMVVKGRAKVFLSSIIDGEVRDHVRQQALKARKAIEEALTDHVALRFLDGIDFSKLGRKQLKAFDEARLAAWEAWKASTGVTMLPNVINADELVNAFLGATPPFGEGRKRHEFPDAITLSSAVAWCAANDAKLVIVSGDGDLQKFCAGRTDLEALPTLSPFLERLAKAESEEVVEKIKEGIDSIEVEVLSYVEKFLTDGEASFTADNADEIEVENVKVTRIGIENITVTSAENGFGSADIDIYAEFLLDFLFEDPFSGHYDYESDTRWGLKRIEQTHGFKETINLSVDFTYDEDDPTEVSFERVTFADDDFRFDVDFSDGNPPD